MIDRIVRSVRDAAAEETMDADDPTRDESEVLAHRLRWAAESLTIEFVDLSRADAEHLVSDVAQELLREAKVAQFVPTFATRRARRLLRDRRAAGSAVLESVVAAPAPAPVDSTTSDVVVLSNGDPIGAGRSDLDEIPRATVAAGREPGPASAPFRSPSDCAAEAKRLLERAKALRAAAHRAAGLGQRL